MNEVKCKQYCELQGYQVQMAMLKVLKEMSDRIYVSGNYNLQRVESETYKQGQCCGGKGQPWKTQRKTPEGAARHIKKWNDKNHPIMGLLLLFKSTDSCDNCHFSKQKYGSLAFCGP